MREEDVVVLWQIVAKVAQISRAAMWFGWASLILVLVTSGLRLYPGLTYEGGWLP
jgi:hypothetical protein